MNVCGFLVKARFSHHPRRFTVHVTGRCFALTLLFWCLMLTVAVLYPHDEEASIQADPAQSRTRGCLGSRGRVVSSWMGRAPATNALPGLFLSWLRRAGAPCSCLQLLTWVLGPLQCCENPHSHSRHPPIISLKIESMPTVCPRSFPGHFP